MSEKTFVEIEKESIVYRVEITVPERKCHNCKRDLSFSGVEAALPNQDTFPASEWQDSPVETERKYIEYLQHIWNCPYIQLFCCTCLKRKMGENLDYDFGPEDDDYMYDDYEWDEDDDWEYDDDFDDDF